MSNELTAALVTAGENLLRVSQMLEAHAFHTTINASYQEEKPDPLSAAVETLLDEIAAKALVQIRDAVIRVISQAAGEPITFLTDAEAALLVDNIGRGAGGTTPGEIGNYVEGYLRDFRVIEEGRRG